ncbi:MAG TPA: DUF305 domain-containing protein [Candidatus Saccharimonadales bacterium]|nr:DUF305 domain-containing protein [Candidatus Saccharimonadales bacterium]
MTLQKETIYVGIIGLLAGIIIAGAIAVAAVNSNNRGMMKMMGMDTSQMKDNDAGHMGMSMNDMSNELKNRTSDDFDKNFVAMMIAHHQGAIDMARLAETRAKHDEVKQLSKEIITAQTKEIEAMKQWQQTWGYTENNSMHNMH